MDEDSDPGSDSSSSILGLQSNKKRKRPKQIQSFVDDWLSDSWKIGSQK
jgi:hypothetical protein